jgi:uncharacterized caspase-like protein
MLPNVTNARLVASVSAVGPLNNPHSDILLVGAALKAVGFTVTEVNDADYRSADAAIKRHIAAVRKEGQGTISLVYYSGHGAADPDTKINYLIPIDVANANDEELWNYSINLNTLVENLRAQAGATHYVVFDACRNELNSGIRDRAGPNCLRQRYGRRNLRQGVGRRNREARRRFHVGLLKRCPSRAA